MTIHQAYQQLLLQLYELYDNREAANIADWCIEHITGFKKIDRIIHKSFPLNKEQQDLFEAISTRLLKNEPVQYVLGEAWFYGMKLYVDDNVLIPRPETEELVEWVIDATSKSYKVDSSIVDIGTGSGCIPIAIKKNLPLANVSAIDISIGALDVATKNAKEQQADISFLQLNFLQEEEWSKLPLYDLIISNPPYIKKSEDVTMRENVLAFEPHLAIFVPDEDALIFYIKIGQFAESHLKESGAIFLEINEALAKEVTNVFKDLGFKSIEVRKDMQGKERMIKVSK